MDLIDDYSDHYSDDHSDDDWNDDSDDDWNDDSDDDCNNDVVFNSTAISIEIQNFTSGLIRSPYQFAEDCTDFFKDTQEERATITAKIRNFSNEKCTFFYTKCQKLSFDFYVTIDANGWKDVDKGYVSIMFTNNKFTLGAFVFSCFICVLDVDGNKRFPQSFSYNYNNLHNLTDHDLPYFGIKKYISRKILLKETSELLPNDILTLNIDITVVGQWEAGISFNLIKSSFKEEGDFPESTFYLCLDSIVAKQLRFESRYFERLLANPMKENETRYMSIPVVEYSSFMIIARFMIGVSFIKVCSVDKIFEVYAVADKYDIPMVTANCLLLLKAYLSVDSSVDLVKLADEYFHDFDHLKGSIKNLLNRHDEDIEVIRDLKEKRRFREWYCEATNVFLGTELLFISKHTSLPAVEEDFPASPFDFYS